MPNIFETITPNIKAIIFDLDGTLADTIPLHLKAWQSAGQALGFHVTDEMIMDHSGTPTVIVAERLGKIYNWKIDPKIIAKAKVDFYLEHKNAAGKIKAIQPIFDIAIKYHNVLPMSVGTGSTRIGALRSLEDIEAVHYFETIVTATDVIHPKPHPETFLRCAEFMKIDPKDCIVFEDGAMGILAAHNAGMKLIDVKAYL